MWRLHFEKLIGLSIIKIIYKTFINKLLAFALYLIIFLLIIFSYQALSFIWMNCNSANINFYNTELFLLIFLALIFYFPKNSQKLDILNSFLSAVPIIGLYLLYDAVFSFLASSPRFSDFKNISTILDFYPLAGISLIIYAVLIFSPLAILLIRYYKNIPRRFYIAVLLLKILLIVFFYYFYCSVLFNQYLQKAFINTPWSQKKTIITNGRFSSMLYFNIQSRISKQKLSSYNNVQFNVEHIYKGNITHKRNIYIVLLESFLDPRLIKNLKFNINPLSVNLLPFLNNNEFSYVISPVYGGRTAQSEFELLSGIKALAKIDTIEFNTMDGYPTHNFVNKLKNNGYNTMAVVASNSSYFNCRRAYKSIGFDNVKFLSEDNNLTTSKDDIYIYDGDIYKYNLKNIQNLKPPFLHYTVGMFGHWPYKRNKEERPDIISLNNSNKDILNISNQFYYRTQCLADYIKAILKNDPSSIIYISSDHLPAIFDANNISYEKDNININIALLLVDGNIINTSGKNYYEIPWLLWDIIAGRNDTGKNIDSNQMELLYFKILSESILKK